MDKAAGLCGNDRQGESRGFHKVDPIQSQPPRAATARPMPNSGLVAEEITMTVNGQLIDGEAHIIQLYEFH